MVAHRCCSGLRVGRPQEDIVEPCLKVRRTAHERDQTGDVMGNDEGILCVLVSMLKDECANQLTESSPFIALILPVAIAAVGDIVCLVEGTIGISRHNEPCEVATRCFRIPTQLPACRSAQIEVAITRRFTSSNLAYGKVI